MPLSYKHPPHPHQARTIAACETRNQFYLGYRPGGGKSGATIHIVRSKMQKHGRFLKTLIICPLSVIETWSREIAKHCPKESPIPAATQLLEGTARRRVSQLHTSGKSVFVTNFEAISMPLLWREIERFGFEILVVDEIHRVKNPRGKRTNKLIALADRVHYRFGLSGTHMPNGPLDIWSQFRIVARGAFPDVFEDFREYYFVDRNAKMPEARYFPDWQMRPERVMKFQNTLSKHMHVVETRDVLSLPPLVTQSVFVDLTPELSKLYFEMESELCTTLEQVESLKLEASSTTASTSLDCTADLVLSQYLRLQQFCSGIFQQDNEGKTRGETRVLPTAKLAALSDLLQSIPRTDKVIIWSIFRPTYAAIAEVCEALKIKYVFLVGEQKSDERQRALDSFNADPDVRVCIGNQACGIGLNGMHVAKHVIYYSKGPSLEQDEQSMARALRPGSEMHDFVSRTDIVTRNTIEEDVTEGLREKHSSREMLLSLAKRARLTVRNAA